MRTLLVLTKQPQFGATIEAVIAPTRFQLIVKGSIPESEVLLARGAIDGIILDAELTSVRAIQLVEELRNVAPTVPIIAYAGSDQPEWEEQAYVFGVTNVLAKPVRARLLTTLVERIVPEMGSHTSALTPAPAPAVFRGAQSANQPRSLEALRRFAGILGHSLDAQALLEHFLLLLREVMGVNRAIVFLRRPAAILSENPLAPDDRWLRSACAIGLDHSVLQHFALSLGAGIGGYLHREGRILRPTHPEALASREITKEFQLLGAQVAIPILDRQSLLGVAVFDERLTGEPYDGDELALIFHMLEEVGLAIRNSWLHDQLTANHRMVADILSHLGNACVVIGENLATLHANAAALRFFLHDRPGKTFVEFSDLPQQIGSLVFTVMKTGVAVPPFKQQFAHAPGRIARVSIVPFRAQPAVSTNSALLLVEDITEHERAVRLETEASNLRLIKSMAEHLAHEIGNALVPLSTHQQLLKEAINDPEFQESLSGAMASGVKRISRLANQMVFLAREWKEGFADSVMLSDLIVEAFHEAHTYHPGKKIAQLAFNKNVAPWRISGDPKALRHAFSEIILNALQANPDDPNVAVSIEEAKPGEQHLLKVEVRDSGKGFTNETARRAQEPFFSTRNIGLGIGLTVSRRIIESHHGRIEIPPSQIGEPGVVCISLPLAN
jgi:signal transduction histidine kinase